MALSSDIKEHIDIIKKLDTNTRPWRNRMEVDYGYYRGNQFEMPKDEGEWDNVTTNRPTTEGNKIIDYLAYARRRLWIPIVDDKDKERKDLSATERLANGIIRLGDEINEADPYGKNIQSQLCFYAPVRGTTIPFVYLSLDDDGKLKPIIISYDPLNTYWIGGSRGINQFWSYRSISKEELEAEYEGVNNANYDSWGRTLVYFTCDKDEMGTFIDGEWLEEPKKHDLDHIPVRIKACRSTPLVQSEKYNDTIKDVGESYLANYRNLVPTLSRLLTYNLTRAGILAKQPIFIGYDGSAGNQPPEIEGNPHAKGAVIPLDKSKGQEILNANTVPTGVNITESLNNVERMASMGGLSQVAYGTLDAALPAQGIDILAHQTMDVMKPFKKHVEGDFIWIAEEVVRQYANGDFGELELEGYDGANNRFRTEIKPKDIKTNWRFECELIPDLLRDEQMNMNMASQGITTGLLSEETALDKYHMVDDVDLEQSKKARARAKQIIHYELWEMAEAMAKDGNEMGFNIVMNELSKLAQKDQQMQQAQSQGTPQPGNPNVMGQRPMMGGSPGSQITVAGMTPQDTTPSVPQELQQKAKSFMSRFKRG